MDIITETKKCTKCGIVKLIDGFYKDKNHSGGRKNSCKKCDKEKSLVRRRMVLDGVLPDKKVCRTCKEEKPVTEFYFSVSNKDGYASQCKRCAFWEHKIKKNIPDRKKVPVEEQKRKSNIRVRRFKDKNREQVREEGRKYYAENKEKYKAWYLAHKDLPGFKEKRLILSHNRRARIYGNGGNFTVQEWVDLCNRYDNVCLKCKRNLPLTHDHVVPVSKGGTNYISNIQPLCLECNVKKNARTIDYRY